MRPNSDIVIVLPAPHGEYSSTISYSDAWAAGEIYALLRKRNCLDVRTPESVGCDAGKSLVLIGGPKVNLIAREFQTASHGRLNFALEDGVIYDKQAQVVALSQYAEGKSRSLQYLTRDCGVIVYDANPFGRATKVLQLAGIRGYGTLAAAIAIVDPTLIGILSRHITASRIADLENSTIEILVSADASRGQVQRDSIGIETITIRNNTKSWSWKSESYRRLEKVCPHRITLEVSPQDAQAPLIALRIDNQKIQFERSPDRLKLIYLLAQKARKDYLSGSQNEGWLSALDLAAELWHIKLNRNIIEIPAEITRTMAGAILTWARHLEKREKLKLDESITLDHDYIRTEVLAVDIDVKKRIADLIYLINIEERHRFGPNFQLIAARPGYGYRLNMHPALIFINSPQALSHSE